VTRPYKRSTEQIPERLLDLLETEGRWMLIAELANLLQAPEATVSRALWRLRERGQVRHRPGKGGHHHQPSYWRAL
jgi:DNA-binding IclR family transcriptional regulator